MEPPLGENVKGAVGEGIIEVEKNGGLVTPLKFFHRNHLPLKNFQPF